MSKRHTRATKMRRSTYVTATEAGTGGRLVLAANVAGVDTEARTITGTVVPYGPAGHTSGGRLTFSAGSLTWSDPKRVKLLREHDQRDVLGYATELADAADGSGLLATFHVPEGPNGDQALAEAANGLRDAFSVGVQLDDATMTALRRSQGAPVAARGALREVSQVSVPAFDDARLSAAGVADLVVSAWTTPTSTTSTTAPTTTAGAAGTTERTTMTPEQLARLAALRAQETLTQAEAAELAQLAALETPTEQPATASAGLATASTASTGPAVVPAVAGAAVVTASPSTYTFGADPEGHSVVTDLLRAGLRGDGEAAERVAKFNAELSAGNPASVAAFVEAAATTGDVDGAGTDLPSTWTGNPNRPELMRTAVDVRRPFISRLERVPISNAQPFAIPSVGKFEGVGDHTEGTPHRPAGTLTLGGDTMQPKAVSGAWEASRELLDASNPVIDRIAAREMLKDYARKSEGKVADLIAARAAQDGSTVYGVSDVMKLRGALIDFINDDEEGADLVALSRGLYKTLGLDEDNDGRPQLPFIGAMNAAGTFKAGSTGLTIDGQEMFRSSKLDTAVRAGVGVAARKDSILWCESPVLQFRFDEVMGPGVVKLALWAYNGAGLLDTADLILVDAGADPTP